MASHKRYIMQLGGSFYKGADILKVLRKHCVFMSEKPGFAELENALKALGARWWVFREPRKVAEKHSRYRRLCKQYGIFRKKKYPAQAVPQPNPPRFIVDQYQQFVAQQEAILGQAQQGVPNGNADPRERPADPANQPAVRYIFR